jgi:putative two-component system response regulator
MLWGALAGVTVLGVSLVGSVMLVRRYDSLLARANERLESEVDRRTRTGLAIRNGLIFGLAKLADYRDTDTGKHLERICRYSELLAEEMLGKHPEIDRPWIDRLKLASSMHDIGKVGIPDAILLKPGPLTPHERQLMELHPIIGADTLVAIRKRVGDDDLLNMGIQVTLSHHERFDGTGYPYRLQGEQIPLAARIVALADIYDALTSARVYKRPISHEEAIVLIRGLRGSHLDPAVVDALLNIEGKFADARLVFATSCEVEERPHLVATAELAAEAQVHKRVA